MEVAELVQRLSTMLPRRLVALGGCVLWPEEQVPTVAAVEAELERLRGALGASARPEEEAREWLERQSNRRFLQSELEWRGIVRPTAAQLRMCANGYASMLRGHLRALRPDLRFVVEVIGVDDAEDEPLEVAVTFYRDRSVSAEPDSD